MLHTPLFSPKFLTDAAKASSQELAERQEHALPIVREWQESLRSGALAATKEEQLQTDFLEAFFAKILGYESSRGAAVWNLEKEQKNVTDSQKADGALGFFSMKDGVRQSDIRAVVELKGAKSDLDKAQNRKEDKRSPVEQAFAYGSKTGGKCRWVIVSNVVEIRLYHVTDQSRYERFELKTLHESEQLRRFLFLLHRARLLNSTNPNEKSELDALHEQRKEQERTISAEFYGKYKAARIQLVEHLKAHNPSHDELLLLQKAQKLLDRLLFVFFCEDLNLLPRQTAHKVIQNAKQSFSADEGEIWRQLKGLFTAIDKGNPPNNISKFNGGLFAPDAEMDALTVSDGMIESLLQFSDYDFDSDLNVRILGHIFEQSVSDIEELKAVITGTAHDTKTGKRKRDGIFYTPEYITRFIVQSTVGAYLEERKQECGFGALPELTDDDFASISISKGVLKANKRIEQHIAAWSAYREHVRTVRVCDPACGSGAFLIEVFDFLYAEGQRVNAELSRLRGGQTEVFDLEKHILTRNIFGVDVNAEAVEITKLSLWLKTANKGKELTDLDGNIKCGNSLVDDASVAGAAAFDWTVQFSSVMEQGGFDVIVGNPPYVRADSAGNSLAFREAMMCSPRYETLSGKWDLYIPFVELSIKFLRPNGYSALIIPDAFCHASYAQSTLAWLKEHNYLQQISYFPTLEIFENVGVKNVIVHNAKLPFKHFTQRIFDATDSYKETALAEYPPKLRLDSKDSVIADKINNAHKLHEICYISVGIVGNSDEKLYKGEFLVEDLISETQDFIHPRMYLEGKDILRYDVQRKRWIEYGTERSPHKWRRKGFTELFEGKPKLITMRSPGYEPRTILDAEQAYYNESAIGFKLWCDLEGVENNSLRNACESTEQRNEYARISQEYSLSMLLAVLNSSLIRYELNTNRRSNIHIYPEDWKNLLIPRPMPQQREQFEQYAETMLTTTRSLADLRKRVLTLLLTKTGIPKASTKLQEWDALTWAELEAEFRKAKVKVSLNDQEELLQYFEQKKAEAERLKTVLATTDHTIDALVYGLYGLTAEEIRVVEGGA